MYTINAKLNLKFTREFSFLTCTQLYGSFSRVLHCILVSHVNSTVFQFITCTPLYPIFSPVLNFIAVSHLYSTVSEFLTCTPLYPSF